MTKSKEIFNQVREQYEEFERKLKSASEWSREYIEKDKLGFEQDLISIQEWWEFQEWKKEKQKK